MRPRGEGPADDEWAEPPIPTRVGKYERISVVAGRTGDRNTGDRKVRSLSRPVAAGGRIVLIAFCGICEYRSLHPVAGH